MVGERRVAWARAGFAAAVAAACAWTLWPFLGPMVWGALVATACEPLAARAERVLGGRRRAAVAVAAALALAVGVPLGFAAVQAAGQAEAAARWAAEVARGPWPEAPREVSEFPLAGPWLAQAWDGLAKDGAGRLAELAKGHAGEAAGIAAGIAGEAGAAAAKAALALLFAAAFMAGAREARREAGEVAAAVFGEGALDWLDMAASAVRGVALGVCGTALCLSLAVACGLALAGVPAVSLLACMAMGLCVAQVGPMPILLPAAGWLAWQGRWGAAAGLGALALALSVVDGLLRPWLIGREIKMPMAMIFAGVVGGLVSMGMLGLFAGPMALAMGRRLWLRAKAAPGNAGG